MGFREAFRNLNVYVKIISFYVKLKSGVPRGKVELWKRVLPLEKGLEALV